MKKSDMLKLIKGHIEYAIEVGAENFAGVWAEHLLHDMEDAGMLPPSIRISTPMGARIFLDTNEWEEDARYDSAGYSLDENGKRTE